MLTEQAVKEKHLEILGAEEDLITTLEGYKSDLNNCNPDSLEIWGVCVEKIRLGMKRLAEYRNIKLDLVDIVRETTVALENAIAHYENTDDP